MVLFYQTGSKVLQTTLGDTSHSRVVQAMLGEQCHFFVYSVGVPKPNAQIWRFDNHQWNNQAGSVAEQAPRSPNLTPCHRAVQNWIYLFLNVFNLFLQLLTTSKNGHRPCCGKVFLPMKSWNCRVTCQGLFKLSKSSFCNLSTHPKPSFWKAVVKGSTQQQKNTTEKVNPILKTTNVL